MDYVFTYKISLIPEAGEFEYYKNQQMSTYLGQEILQNMHFNIPALPLVRDRYAITCGEPFTNLKHPEINSQT